VADEVLNGGEFPDLAALKAAFTEPWLQVADLADTDADADARLEECRALINLHQIDMGEASALVLAQQLATQGTAALLLIDEHRGRQAAQHCQVAIIGTAGLLVLAKQAGAVDKVRPLLLALREGGYFLSDRLVEAVLAQSGE
jgi:predicted nucleic acid-binding protein